MYNMGYRAECSNTLIVHDTPRWHMYQAQSAAPKRIVTTLKYDLEQFSIQGYAQQYFNQHKKWFLFLRS